MRVNKPKVEYKLALQEKPQESILAYYYKTNNLTRIKLLNTRLIIANNNIRHEIPFKTKRVKYTAICKKTIKIVKESKLSFFYPVFLLNFFYSRLHNFIIFAPRSWIPSTTILIFSLNFIIFPPQYYSLLHNFIIFPSPPPPHFYCFPSSSSSSSSSPSFLLFSLHHQHHHRHHISITFPPPPPPPPPPYFYCFPSTTTTDINNNKNDKKQITIKKNSDT